MRLVPAAVSASRKARPAALALTAIALCVASISPAYGAANLPPVAPAADKTPEFQSFIKEEDLPELTQPLPSAEFIDWATVTQEKWISDDRFANVHVGEDQNSVAVYWYGDAAPIEKALSQAPDGVTWSVEPALFLPGDLRRFVGDLMSAPPEIRGVSFVSAYANADGSGVTVTVDRERDSAETTVIETLIDRRKGTANFPVTLVEGDALDPAWGRFDDPYRAGGGQIFTATSACTAGYEVTSDIAGETGMMTAAHCGPTGTSWYHSALGPVPAAGTYSYGTTNPWTGAVDGAIITGAPSYAYLSGLVWYGPTGSSSLYQLVGGPVAPLVGVSLCMNGAPSGTVCSNTITQTGVTYNLGLTGLTAVYGVISVQAISQPAAGNGDSGGPGLVLVAAPGGGANIRASTIISAIPAGSGTACNGQPGSATRRCSATVYSTSARQIGLNTGFNIVYF